MNFVGVLLNQDCWIIVFLYFIILFLFFFVFFFRLFLGLCFWRQIFIEDFITDKFLNLIEFFKLMIFFKCKLLRISSFPSLNNHIFNFLVVYGVGIEIFNGVHLNTDKILECALFILLLNSAFLIIDKLIVSVIVVYIRISFFIFFADFAWWIKRSLQYFFLQFVNRMIKK